MSYLTGSGSRREWTTEPDKTARDVEHIRTLSQPQRRALRAAVRDGATWNVSSQPRQIIHALYRRGLVTVTELTNREIRWGSRGNEGERLNVSLDARLTEQGERLRERLVDAHERARR